ncbi:hypothetical protein INT45_002256 [Circinella minor]|uniref:Uncharacterized protein n=1 Tax=Circinella minor TaxID=1195481 RepID=A0A8H7VLY9_9FUNG|nr:hypothetical protein INT45_002256 [Circinella minor]
MVVFTSHFKPVEEPQMGTMEFLFKNHFDIPDKRPLFIDFLTGEKLTYGDFKDQILQFAAGLQDKHSFTKGDVMLIYAPNDYKYTVPLMGAVAAGGATSPANPNYTVHELVHQLKLTQAKVMIAHVDNIDNALEAAKEVGLPKKNIYVFGYKALQGCLPFLALMGSRRAELVHLTPEESKELPAYLCFSSGTTGPSKGVITTHANMNVNLLQYCASDGPFIDGKNDCTFATLPFFHVFALTNILHLAFYIGTPVYVLKRFHLETVCKLIESKKISFGYMVPPILLQIVKEPVAQKYDLSSVKWIQCAAAPLAPELLTALKARLPTCAVKQAYGLTETSPVATSEIPNDTRPGSVGYLLPNMTAKLVNEDGKEVGYDERGEIWLKGPNIMKGYIRNPQATADAIDKDGYFHTGDVGVVDKENRFYIVDRLKELIKYKGFQVPPAELEALLLKSPDVADAAVIGVYDPEQATEIPTGYIKVAPNVPKTKETSDRIKKFVADKVVSYKQIRNLIFLDVIPKSESGKILRRVLRTEANEAVKAKIAAKAESSARL